MFDRYKWNIEYRKKHPHIVKNSNSKRMLFMNKQIHVEKNPRKGVCLACGKQGLTHIHHLQYHKDDPLKDAIELCPKCHGIITYYKEQFG